MFRLLVCAMLVGGVFATVVPQASAQKKKVEVTKMWKGSV